MAELWVWIRVPLSALERAVAALKESVMRKHYYDQRQDADKDETAAEAIKKAVRDENGPPL